MSSRLVVTVVAAALLAGPALADTKAGVEAWARGDYRTAVEEWKKAARAGDADAQYNLGQAYKLGRGVPLDNAAAQGWYEKAAAQGHVEAADNYGLALFQNNRAHDAIPYLEKSAARGEPRAQYILGTMLFNGTDIKKNWPRAYALTSRSAAAGLPQAAKSLGQMDGYLSAKEKQAGLALAANMAGPTPAPSEVTGQDNAPGLRGVDLPPAAIERGTPATRAAPPTVHAPPARTSAPKTPPAAVKAAAGGWALQLGAFGDPANARKLGGSVAAKFPGRAVDYVKAGALTRVVVGLFPSKAAASAACGTLKPCVPVER